MKKSILSIACLITLSSNSQTWTKISGIMDSTQVKGIGVINNQILVAGASWASSSITDYAITNDGGTTWNKLPTYSFAGYLPNALPQNTLMLVSNGFTTTKKLMGSTWQPFNTANMFAEFGNGSIIGCAGFSPDTVYNFSASGIKGTKLGNYKARFSAKYCQGSGNRIFVFAYGGGLHYIDYSNLGVLNFPATLDGSPMTDVAWQAKNIIDMVKLSGGTLIAVDGLGYGIMKSTDNGVNWITTNNMAGVQFGSPSIISIAKNSSDDIFIINSNKVWKTNDLGVTFTDISGTLPSPNSFRIDLFVNTSNDLFCITNANGSVDATKSGIYKLSGTSGLKENTTNFQVVTYPNPVINNFTISASTNIETIEVTDLIGKIILTTQPKNNSVIINLSNEKEGIYFVKIQSQNSSKSIKVIKE